MCSTYYVVCFVKGNYCLEGEGTSRMSRIPRRTASSRTIEAHTGTHIFEIDDYSQKKGGTDVGKIHKVIHLHCWWLRLVHPLLPQRQCLSLVTTSLSSCSWWVAMSSWGRTTTFNSLEGMMLWRTTWYHGILQERACSSPAISWKEVNIDLDTRD